MAQLPPRQLPITANLLRHVGFAILITGFLKGVLCCYTFHGHPYFVLSSLPLCFPALVTGSSLATVNSGHAAVSLNGRLRLKLIVTCFLSFVVLLLSLIVMAYFTWWHVTSDKLPLSLHSTASTIAIALFALPDVPTVALCFHGIRILQKVSSWRNALIEEDRWLQESTLRQQSEYGAV
jgi:hypothetical protein